MWYFFFFKQKTAYEMRTSDWSSDVCSSDLRTRPRYRCRRAQASEQRLDAIPQAARLGRVRRVCVVHECIDEHSEIGRREAEAVKVGPPAAVAVDHVRDHAVHLQTVRGRRELVAEGFGKLPRIVRPVRPARQEEPVRERKSTSLK